MDENWYGKPFFHFIFKSAVMLVDVEVISFIRIIGYKYIWPAIIVDLLQKTQSKTDKPP